MCIVITIHTRDTVGKHSHQEAKVALLLSILLFIGYALQAHLTSLESALWVGAIVCAGAFARHTATSGLAITYCVTGTAIVMGSLALVAV